jgi:hypothetical protein
MRFGCDIADAFAWNDGSDSVLERIDCDVTP